MGPLRYILSNFLYTLEIPAHLLQKLEKFFLFKFFDKNSICLFYDYNSKWLILFLAVDDNHLFLSKPSKIVCSFPHFAFY